MSTRDERYDVTKRIDSSHAPQRNKTNKHVESTVLEDSTLKSGLGKLSMAIVSACEIFYDCEYQPLNCRHVWQGYCSRWHSVCPATYFFNHRLALHCSRLEYIGKAFEQFSHLRTFTVRHCDTGDDLCKELLKSKSLLHLRIGTVTLNKRNVDCAKGSDVYYKTQTASRAGLVIRPFRGLSNEDQ